MVTDYKPTLTWISDGIAAQEELDHANRTFECVEHIEAKGDFAPPALLAGPAYFFFTKP